MPLIDKDPPGPGEEPFVKRWRRAPRLLFLVAAGAGCWGAVILLAWLLLRRLSS